MFTMKRQRDYEQESDSEKQKCRRCRQISPLSSFGVKKNATYNKTCVVCIQKSYCSHNRVKSRCRECKGREICKHNKRISVCKECKGGSICEHNKLRSICKECKGGSICEHDNLRHRCNECKLKRPAKGNENEEDSVTESETEIEKNMVKS